MVVSNIFYFHPNFGEDSHFDEHIFQKGWFKHQLEKVSHVVSGIFVGTYIHNADVCCHCKQALSCESLNSTFFLGVA